MGIFTAYRPDGGASGFYGTVFKFSTNGGFSILYSFTGEGDGAYPESALVQGSDGNLYGTTSFARANIYGGTVFRIATNGTLTNLYSFTGGTDGAYPNGLVQASDGSFYGTTFFGGRYGNGTVFKITGGGMFTSLYSFTNGNDGAIPQAGLVRGSDGNFYGTTSSGGTNGGYGTVFEVGTNGTFTSLYSFTGGIAGDACECSGARPRPQFLRHHVRWRR